ncbi:hypothetical protein [Bacillus sp. NPDC094077]|uniref:hypothetical protein n=1 Tax=Bacillus sp. NPDC094077 TaxID=3390932 RepID=UPI003CFF4BBC
MNDWLFDNSDWCDICGDVILSADVKSMHIEGCEKTLCKSCRGEYHDGATNILAG